ncbi:hypothetical protein ACLKA7_014796 [Drosophila subpalustris]
MNNTKPRSSLKKVTTEEGQARRRISFSGKKFIREFDTTEKPRDYDNSYEISDHNGDDSSGQSHVTAAASTLHVSARISVPNEIDKENTPLASASESIALEYDQQNRNDFTLQLQTSVNVTLMPHELAKNRRLMELSAPLDSMAFDSLSLSDVERDKLREYTMFKTAVSDKTMDLMPQKMQNPESPEKASGHKTVVMLTDMSCVTPMERNVKQKTVLFENNNDITCDFSDIAPQQVDVVAAATTEQMAYESFNMGERDSLNYLPDDSTCSPLIPLDVISENGIRRPLNCRELNEALNSGSIKPFRSGPRTPLRLRNVKQQHFWQGLEQNPVEEDVPLREIIKPRGTLDFNESTVMSPIPQQQHQSHPVKDHSDGPFKMKSLADVKRNNRFSQADELMLDNTNFLAHAKMGDETQSRNTSKSASRRETTYDNTAMELDELDKQEAAVVAAFEKAKHRPTVQHLAAMDESDLINSSSQNLIDNVHKDTVDLQSKQRLSRTIQLHVSMEEECLKPASRELRKTLNGEEAIEEQMAMETSVGNAVEQEYRFRRKTLHFTEAIDEDIPSPRKDLHSIMIAPQRRQTLQFAEDIEETLSPGQNKHLILPVKEQATRRRQTLHMAEAIEEDIVRPQKEFSAQPAAASVEHQTGRRRQTLHMAEAIEEEDTDRDTRSPSKDIQVDLLAPPVKQQSGRRRQSLHIAEPMEEDPIGGQQESKSQQATAPEEQQSRRRRQTIQRAEPIEEENIVKPTKDLNAKSAASAKEKDYAFRRQTLCSLEDIEEDCVRPLSESQLNSVVTLVEKQSSKHRQTLYLAEPIEEEPVWQREDFKAPSEAASVAKPIEEDIVKPQFKQMAHRRQTLQLVEDIDEEMPSPDKNLHSLAPRLEQQLNRCRQTLNVAEPIEEDLIRPQMASKSQIVSAPKEQQSRTRRQTIQMSEPIEEEIVKPANDFKANSAAAAVVQEYSIRRQTLPFSEEIQEDFVRPPPELQLSSVAAAVEQQNNRRRQTLHMAELIEEDSFSSHRELTPTTTAAPIDANSKLKSRQTFHLSQPIEEDICGAPSIKMEENRPRQTLIMSEAIMDDLSSIELGSSSPVASKPRQTLGMAIAIDEDLPCAPPTEQRSKKSGMKFLSTNESEFLSPSFYKITENAEMESQIDSAEWLAQENAKLRKTLVDRIKGEGPKKVVDSLIANATCMETPQRNKTQRGIFPITPGRSMIEYEDLETLCNKESPAAAAEAPEDMELDMDFNNYGTPVVAPKSSTSLNIKRLPIHLTPNFPQSKKRNTCLPIKQEDQKSSQLQVDATGRDEEDVSATIRNRSRIPVPCKSSPWRETEPEQLDGTVQMVRAQMMRQTRSCFETEIICPPQNKAQLKPAGMYEDNPITISDVSSHFAAQNELAKRSLANAADEPKNTSSNSRSSNENSNKSYVTAHKKFTNLGGDSAIIDLAFDDYEIDKTRLSLVSTLMDEEQDGVGNGSGIDIKADPDSEPEPETQNQTDPEACLQQLNPPAVAGAVDACKKCKHCRLSINDTVIDASESFKLPDWNALEEGLADLDRLRQQPRLDEVHKYWELKKLARYSNASDNVGETILDDNDNEERLTLQEMMEMFNKKLEELKGILPEPVVPTPFAKRLAAKVRSEVPRWIFDYQLQCDRQYIITHRKITTFRMVINYERQDIMENDIRVRNIKAMTTTIIPKPYWLPLEHLMDFQVRLKLPLNLHNLLDGNDVDDIVKFLKHVDSIFMETTRLCKNLKLILMSKRARLLREPNRTFVRKTVRKMIQEKDEAYMRVENINFLIEIGNVEEISFRDILQPPLYQFDEKIQFLPKGIDFLDAFLENPEQYLKYVAELNN